MGRALIYVWAKNQAIQSKSSYLLQNKRAYRTNTDDNDDDDADDDRTMGPKAAAIDRLRIDDKTKSTDACTLPIHTNRTQFEHTDILVPWKLKNPIKQSDANGSTTADDQPSPSAAPSLTFLRFYHVFDEGELERMCQRFSKSISIEKSYYDQGNWCVILRKRSQ